MLALGSHVVDIFWLVVLMGDRVDDAVTCMEGKDFSSRNGEGKNEREVTRDYGMNERKKGTSEGKKHE